MSEVDQVPTSKNRIRLTRGYAPRAIRFIGCVTREKWHIKAYVIHCPGRQHGSQLVDKVLRLADTVLARAPRSPEHYYVAIAIAHAGADGDYALVDWWTGENMLSHHVFSASLAPGSSFEPFTCANIAACAWELQILGFEGRQWLAHVLSRPEAPDVQRYLNEGLTEEL